MSWSSRSEKLLKPLEKVDVDASWFKCAAPSKYFIKRNLQAYKSFSVLPSGSSVLSTKGLSGSYWTRTARIDVKLSTGETKAYFLKLASCENGIDMVRGEFESMRAIHSVSPDFAPYPVGYGTYETDPATHFFLCDFIDVADKLPNVEDFCERLADLHRRSMAASPNGLYGFHVTTYNGNLPQDNTWTESWEAFFLRGLRRMFALEESAQGPSQEIKDLLPALYDKVVPRLLRPLETDGRTLKPCLVHGDLSEFNAAVDLRTGRSLIFDSSAFWAHNEYDLHMWRPTRFKVGDPHIKEYLKHFPPSAPVEDWDDRNLLYSLRADLHDSALYASTTSFRELVIITMKQLVDKYPNGYEGTAPQKRSAIMPAEASPDTTASVSDSSKL